MIQLRSLSLLAFAAIAGLASAQEIYMQGLNAPRNMYFDTDGTLLVTEAGSGGFTGRISGRKNNDAQTEVVGNLPSAAAPDGSDSVGPADVRRTADGKLAVLFGLGGGPDRRNGLGAGYEMLGTLSYYDQGTQTWTMGEDFIAREAAEDPDFTGNPAVDEINSNPFSFVQDGNGYAVADAGANALWRDGSFVLFPRDTNTGMDIVPTSVLARPGGGFMVGGLGGGPFIPGASHIFTLDENGNVVDNMTGFTMIIDMAYAPDGSLLVTQFIDKGLAVGQTPGAFDPTGSVKRIRPDGTVETLISGLITPSSIAFGQDGMLYVASNGGPTLGGIVTRYNYQPVPEPATIAALGLGAAAMLRRRKRA